MMFEVLRTWFRRSKPPHSVSANPRIDPPVDELPTFVFIDIETTGLNRDGTDEVLEIAILDAEGNILLNTLVRPVRNTAWPQAQAIHGISPSDVACAPTWGELLPSIAAICSSKTVVCYNVSFDAGFFPPEFFPSISCAMRRYSEANPNHRNWVRLSEAAAEAGYVSTGAYHRALEDAFACRHLWLFEIPRLEKAYPTVTSPEIFAEMLLEPEMRLPLVFNTLFQEELRFVSVNDQCRLWTKDNRDEIHVYRPRTLGGSGKIATLSKADNAELANRLQKGEKIEMLLTKRNGGVFVFDVIRTEAKNRKIAPPPDTPIKLSPIDSDIFKCFIAHRSGMCGAIGEWEDFYVVEAEITRICKEGGGQYYKSKAKGAKFAIIFDPYSHTTDRVWGLQQEGYKVTTFDKVVAHFELTHLWDCPRYMAYVHSLRNYVDNSL